MWEGSIVPGVQQSRRLISLLLVLPTLDGVGVLAPFMLKLASASGFTQAFSKKNLSGFFSGLSMLIFTNIINVNVHAKTTQPIIMKL